MEKQKSTNGNIKTMKIGKPFALFFLHGDEHGLKHTCKPVAEAYVIQI